MFTEVDVFIGNNTLIDPKIYDYWLNGLSGNGFISFFGLYKILIILI